jgi:glyoxylase-like metal-dependent hydrolase (beta-lactamase superfamily II)
MDVRELRPGLWRWTAAHPEWEEGLHWPQLVGSVYAELPEAVVVIDPQVPPDAPERFWEALDRDVQRLARPVHVLLTVHWHERSVEAVLDRYRATLWRPDQPGELPSGVRAEIVEGADWVEALFYLETWRALVVGDLLIDDGEGGLRIPLSWFPKEEQDWARAGLKERLRAVLALDVDLVLVSHGEPVLEDGHVALERALSP